MSLITTVPFSILIKHQSSPSGSIFALLPRTWLSWQHEVRSFVMNSTRVTEENIVDCCVFPVSKDVERERSVAKHEETARLKLLPYRDHCFCRSGWNWGGNYSVFVIINRGNAYKKRICLWTRSYCQYCNVFDLCVLLAMMCVYIICLRWCVCILSVWDDVSIHCLFAMMFPYYRTVSFCNASNLSLPCSPLCFSISACAQGVTQDTGACSWNSWNACIVSFGLPWPLCSVSDDVCVSGFAQGVAQVKSAY